MTTGKLSTHGPRTLGSYVRCVCCVWAGGSGRLGSSGSDAGAPSHDAGELDAAVDAEADGAGDVPDGAASDSAADAPLQPPCPPPALSEAGLPPRPSCAGAGTCACDSNCCDEPLVPGGWFPMGRSLDGSDAFPDLNGYWDDLELPEHPAYVTSFYLDTFEVTVGRFRPFFDAYPESIPAEGAGEHPSIPGSGWHQEFNQYPPKRDRSWSNTSRAVHRHRRGRLHGRRNQRSVRRIPSTA